MSLFPQGRPDEKKKEIPLIQESGKDYPEGESHEAPVKYYKVICPYCRQMPGFPCVVNKRKEVDYRLVHISRVILYEAFELGTVDVNGIGRNGQTYRPSWGKE